MQGWVCVGAMARFEVQVWWEGGHIQISSTCMGPPISQHCCVLILLSRCEDGCGDCCAGSLVVLSRQYFLPVCKPYTFP